MNRLLLKFNSSVSKSSSATKRYFCNKTSKLEEKKHDDSNNVVAMVGLFGSSTVLTTYFYLDYTTRLYDKNTDDFVCSACGFYKMDEDKPNKVCMDEDKPIKVRTDSKI